MTLCLLSVLLLLLVITVEYGDDEDDDGGDTRSSRTRITGSYDDLDDVTRGSGGLDDFWGLGQQGQGRYCRERGQLAVCRPPDAVIIAEGDLGSRLSSVCSAAALLPAANLTTLALWVPDAFMPHIRFSDLFTLAAAAAAAAGNPAPPPDVEGRALRAVAGEGGEGLSSGGREESRGGTDLGNVTEGGTGANSSSSGGRGGSGGSSSSGGDGGGSKGSGAGRFVWVEEANETAAHWRQFLALTHRPVRNEQPLSRFHPCICVMLGAFQAPQKFLAPTHRPVRKERPLVSMHASVRVLAARKLHALPPPLHLCPPAHLPAWPPARLQPPHPSSPMPIRLLSPPHPWQVTIRGCQKRGASQDATVATCSVRFQTFSPPPPSPLRPPPLPLPVALTWQVTIRGCQKRGASQDAAVASLTLSLYLSPASINWLVVRAVCGLYLSPASINWLVVRAVGGFAFERLMGACMTALHLHAVPPTPLHHSQPHCAGRSEPACIRAPNGSVHGSVHGSAAARPACSGTAAALPPTSLPTLTLTTLTLPTPPFLQPDLSLDGCPGCPISTTSSPHLCATRRLAMSFLKRPSLDFALAARTALNAARISDAFHPSRAPFVLRATQSRAATCPKGERADLGKGGVEEWRKGGGGGVVELFALSMTRGLISLKAGLASRQAMFIALTKAVELFALSMTRGLISLKGGLASPQAMFIAAHGATRSDIFRVQRPVCDSPPLLPLTQQKLARFTIIEESLKLVYCAIPKVACNSWLMWLRARLGLPNPEDPLLALNEKEWGLHELALDFTEEQAIRLMTRLDFFKFSFVRNPFSRIASAYSNKLVRTDRPKLKTGTGWGTRQYWSNVFFHAVKPMYEAVKDSTGLVSFPDFVRLVGKLLASHRADMDRHLAPQEDICALGSIKYDFVGRFERLEEDVKTVVDRFGGEHLDVFRFGKGAHFTDTDRRLTKLYDKVCVHLLCFYPHSCPSLP
ncbi:unnamed protein product [Closterium sp. Naga37s-1]|nr:unnamed protein product [Closterium sp. Naga37s-1]